MTGIGNIALTHSHSIKNQRTGSIPIDLDAVMIPPEERQSQTNLVANGLIRERRLSNTSSNEERRLKELYEEEKNKCSKPVKVEDEDSFFSDIEEGSPLN